MSYGFATFDSHIGRVDWYLIREIAGLERISPSMEARSTLDCLVRRVVAYSTSFVRSEMRKGGGGCTALSQVVSLLDTTTQLVRKKVRASSLRYQTLLRVI